MEVVDELTDTHVCQKAVARLWKALETDSFAKKVISKRNNVLGRFQKSFSPENVSRLEEDEFRAFLRFENNLHWTALQGNGPRMCRNMSLLRNSLVVLLDDEQPIENRLNKAVSAVPGMGAASATAILVVANPDEYGAWTSLSEMGLKELNLWPCMDRGESLGYRYTKVNKVLRQLADELRVDLWTLDILWWAVGD